MNQCKRHQQLLMRYFDHDLTDREEKLLKQHLNSCPDCQSLFSDLNHLLGVLESTLALEPDPGLEKMVLNRIKSPSVPPAVNDFWLANIIYGSLTGMVILLFFTADLALRNSSGFELLLAGRHYLDSFTQVILVLQIFYQFFFRFFSGVWAATLGEIQSFFTAAVFLAVCLVGIAIKKHLTKQKYFLKNS